MKRALPSQEFGVGKQTTRHVHRNGPHVITTEAQTLDQALDIIAARQRKKKRADGAQATSRENNTKPTLRQELARARFVSRSKDVSLAGGDVAKGARSRRWEKYHANQSPKPPRPFKDLPEDEKQKRAVEMFRSGAWGIGARAGRKLAQTFGVDHATMAAWLGIEIWKAADFNDVMALRR